MQLPKTGRLATWTVDTHNSQKCSEGTTERNEPEHTGKRMPPLPGIYGALLK